MIATGRGLIRGSEEILLEGNPDDQETDPIPDFVPTKGTEDGAERRPTSRS
jgi:hypothetical protein